MSDGSQIEWTDATWNPATGCTKISPGCAHCYIDRTPAFRIAGRKFVKGHIPLQLHPDRLDKPLHWRRPRMVFVNSLSDLFHKDVPFDFVDRVFAVMALCPQHTFQILTKRPERMAEYFSSRTAVMNLHWLVGPGISTHDEVEEWCRQNGITRKERERRRHISHYHYYPGECRVPPWPLPHVWLGTSVEDQKRADERIQHLRRCPAAVRFLSCEPLLGPLTLDLDGIQWVIAGGESGPNARPTHPDWIRSLRDQCTEAGVPFFFKQWGEWVPSDQYPAELDGVRLSRFPRRTLEPGHQHVFRVGKKRAGRLLDGEEWSEFHEAAELAASSR